MNFAGIYGLPVVFFCQNNGWAISVPTESQVAGGSVAARAEGYGLVGNRVDGNDVLAVHRATEAAILRARSGGGATVIEAMTYRAGPHSTSDDPGRYRTLAEEQDWLTRDPLALAEAQLRGLGYDDGYFAGAAERASELAAVVRDGVAALGARPGEEMFDFVFAEPTASLLEQKRAWQEAARG
jgi:pyruvate dehydrogenase E1 component alpha subunit